MRYMGGKQRIAKRLCEFLNSQMQPGQPFVDLFCGAVNVVSNIDPNRVRIANDLNPYLASLWVALQTGWTPPESVTAEEYVEWKKREPVDLYERSTKAFIGFGCSFGGKWFSGFAESPTRDYSANARNSCLKKAEKIADVLFYSRSYADVPLPSQALIYCDIPYKGTTQYNAVGGFGHEVFYQWLRDNSHREIYVSEYTHNVPDFCEVVWTVESVQGVRSAGGKKKATVEVLYRVKK